MQVLFSFGQIFIKFWIENMISTYAKDFPWKNGSNLLDFEEKKFKLPNFYDN